MQCFWLKRLICVMRVIIGNGCNIYGCIFGVINSVDFFGVFVSVWIQTRALSIQGQDNNVENKHVLTANIFFKGAGPQR